MSVNSRRQALELCLDAAVIIVIQIGDEFLLEVFHGIEVLKIEQFTLQKSEEIFYHSIIQTIPLSAHTLDDTVIGQRLLVLLVLVLPALIGVQNGSCPRGSRRVASSTIFMTIESTGRSEIT